MPPNGKEAQGLRGFPTPNNVPADGGYIVFRLPADNEWAGLILGAAEELAKEYNWYQWGDMTPEEAALAFQAIVNQAPYNACGCNYPNGSRVLRLSQDGDVEQLTDGEWTPPTDDYEIPPTPAREEATCDERRCAAAANAVNVLEMLYEEVSDAIAGGASEAEALAVLIGAAVIIVGGWLGLVLAALVTAIVAAFVGFVELAAMLGTDVWGEDFSDKLKCYLYECSSCDGDVVTFDFQCVREKMATYVDVLDVNFINNLRLFGQVDFILNVIGVDGLNAAGATTAITDADCDECIDASCTAFIGRVENQLADIDVFQGTVYNDMTGGEYVVLADYVSGAQKQAAVRWDIPTGITATRLAMQWKDGSNVRGRIWLNPTDYNPSQTIADTTVAEVLEVSGSWGAGDYIVWTINGDAPSEATLQLVAVDYEYDGIPDPYDDNC